jgi:hypothetical protein
MTNPVTRAGARPAPDITYNDALSGGSARTFAESVPVKEPPVERVSRGAKEKLKEARGPAKHALEHGVVHKLTHGKSEVARGFGLKVAGPLVTLSLMYDAFKTISGPPTMNETQKAHVREQFSQATALMARHALPREYVQARVTDEAAATARLGDAKEHLGVRLGSAEKADAAMVNFQKQIEQSVFQGMEFAAAYGLRAPKDLDALLARDASFRDRFQNDLAFQEGVRAMVWLGQNKPAEFEARLVLFVSQKAATTSTAARPLQ